MSPNGMTSAAARFISSQSIFIPSQLTAQEFHAVTKLAAVEQFDNDGHRRSGGGSRVDLRFFKPEQLSVGVFQRQFAGGFGLDCPRERVAVARRHADRGEAF